jgi:hypothetical protein
VLTLPVATLIFHGCPGELVVLAAIIGTSSVVCFFWMFGNDIAQAATTCTMLVQQRGNTVDNAFRHKRRITYKRWLWWTRFGILVMALQVAGATYLAIVLIKKEMDGHGYYAY